jgi:hypothetical protein
VDSTSKKCLHWLQKDVSDETKKGKLAMLPLVHSDGVFGGKRKLKPSKRKGVGNGSRVSMVPAWYLLLACFTFEALDDTH